jgi:DNA-binding CsgD family transcriptional regulator
LACATAPRQPLALLAAHRALGELATESRDYDEAQAHLLAALTLAEACAAPYERALTLLSLADLRAVADRSAAQAVLAEARLLLESLGARPTLARAAALAARLRSGQASAPAGLTPREVEVLRLVAAGLTDAQIAARLARSPRTVQHHLRAIYAKLGVATRSAATRFAFEHGLA